MDHNNILGTVLAGGKSQRFGEDKSQVKLANFTWDLSSPNLCDLPPASTVPKILL